MFAQSLSLSCTVDGVAVTLCPKPLPDALHAAAAKAGFDIISRLTDKDRLLIRCRHCGKVARKRRNVVRDHRPDCHACIRTRREAAAARIGAVLLGPDPGNRHYGLFHLACGHVVRRQYLRVESAATDGHAVGCTSCRTARYAEEAADQGWTLIGAATGDRLGYRRYRHGCGQMQDIAIANMKFGDVDCSRCGESWASKPSQLYLFWIGLGTGEVLKLGYSSNPQVRLRQQLGIAKETPTRILRTVPVSTGHRAQRVEKAIHTRMRRDHPALIVPKPVFGDAINTQSEIYETEALRLLNAELDAIATRKR